MVKDVKKHTRYEHITSSAQQKTSGKRRCEGYVSSYDGEEREMRTTFGCINPEDANYCDHLFQVGIWPGAGYFLDTMLVWGGDSALEAILEIAAGWCEENAKYLLVPDDEIYDMQGDYVRDAILDDPEKYGFTPEDVESVKDMSMDEICNRIGGDDVWYNLCDEALEAYGILYVDPQLYVRGENLRIEEVNPNDYLLDGIYPDDYDKGEDVDYD